MNLIPNRPQNEKPNRKIVRISSSPPKEIKKIITINQNEEKESNLSHINSNNSNNNSNNSSNSINLNKIGKDARILVPKAQELRNRITDDDSQSRRLLRNIYTAESSLFNISIEEKIVEFYLKTKFDSIILQEFAKQILTSTFDSVLKCNGEFDTTIEIENILKDDLNSQINSLLYISNNFRELIYDICTRILDYCEIPVAEDITYPNLCSSNLNMMMSCFRSYLSLHKSVEEMERLAAERDNENFIQNLKQQKALTEQELANMTIEYKALKARHDSLFSEGGGKNQTVIRQQSIIDSLEIQIRSFHKQIEEIQMERRKFNQTEAMLKGELLMVTTQYNSLKSLYESEISNLRPLFQQQVIQIAEDKKEMLNLRSDIELSAKRFLQSEEKLLMLQQELFNVRKDKNNLERKILQLEQKLLESSQENKKQMKLLEITLAAKISSDSIIKETEKKRYELEKQLQELKVLKGLNDSHIEQSVYEKEEIKKELEILREEMNNIKEGRSGDRAEREAQELIIEELRNQLNEIQQTGFTPEKQIEWDEKENQLKDANEQLRKLKNQLKLALTRVHEMQEEIDSLRTKISN